MPRNASLSVLFILCCLSCSEPKSPVTAPPAQTVDTVTATPVTADVQSNGLPASGSQPEAFVPAGYFIQYRADGDINGDRLPDVAMVIRQTDDSATARAVLVLLQEAGGVKYRLADAGWKAIGPQCNQDGYPIRGTEDLSIEDGSLELYQYEPGPAGNLFSTYHYLDGEVQLVVVEMFAQGAGGASGRKLHLQTGLIEDTEINRMKDPEEATESTETGAPQKILLRDANPDELMFGKDHL